MLTAICVLLLGGTMPSFGQVTRALLTVKGLNLPPEQNLRAFKINTWAVSLLAVCKVPTSWEMKAEKYEDAEGFLSGRSDAHGVPLRELREMFLVDVYSYQPLPKGDPKSDFHPASFSGWVEIANARQPFKRVDDRHAHRRALNAGNFHLTSASHCPIPPPTQP
jgi:hypothetical protein